MNLKIRNRIIWGRPLNSIGLVSFPVFSPIGVKQGNRINGRAGGGHEQYSNSILFVSLFVPSLTYGQSIDNVDIGRDVKSLTISKVDDIKIEKLPKGCIKKSG